MLPGGPQSLDGDIDTLAACEGHCLRHGIGGVEDNVAAETLRHGDALGDGLDCDDGPGAVSAGSSRGAKADGASGEDGDGIPGPGWSG